MFEYVLSNWSNRQQFCLRVFFIRGHRAFLWVFSLFFSGFPEGTWGDRSESSDQSIPSAFDCEISVSMLWFLFKFRVKCLLALHPGARRNHHPWVPSGKHGKTVIDSYVYSADNELLHPMKIDILEALCSALFAREEKRPAECFSEKKHVWFQ